MDRRMLSRDEESGTDTNVTRADQDKINRFSTLHQKQGLLQDELTEKNQEKEYLSDVTTELELFDEDSGELIPYKIGDSFIHLPLEEVQSLLETATEKIEKQIDGLKDRIDGNKQVMDELKVELYAKFGKAINLEV